MPLTLDPARVERDSTVLDIAEISVFLQKVLGQQITAYLGGIKDPKMVGRWAAGKTVPRDLVKMRLRHGYQAARLIAGAYDPDTARAWLFGTNSRLDDAAPAYLLRYAQSPDDLRHIVAAARAFAGAAA